LQAKVDIAQSKQRRAAEREEFLMTEVSNVSKDLACKRTVQPPSIFINSVMMIVIKLDFFPVAGIQLNSADERRRVENRLRTLANNAGSDASIFWSDRGKAFILATLQDRASQVGRVIGSCKSALANIYQAMFPLNKQPDGLFSLLKKLCDFLRTKVLVRRQLVGGAKVALAVAKAHYPDVDLGRIGQGTPPAADGGAVDLRPYYSAAADPAVKLMHLGEEETDSLLAQGWEPRF
jgi:hypothetical protein